MMHPRDINVNSGLRKMLAKPRIKAITENAINALVPSM